MALFFNNKKIKVMGFNSRSFCSFCQSVPCDEVGNTLVSTLVSFVSTVKTIYTILETKSLPGRFIRAHVATMKASEWYWPGTPWLNPDLGGR
jgi:hypothetical protein